MYASPRNSMWITRPFLLVRGWGLGTRLTHYLFSCDSVHQSLWTCKHNEMHKILVFRFLLPWWWNSSLIVRDQDKLPYIDVSMSTLDQQIFSFNFIGNFTSKKILYTQYCKLQAVPSYGKLPIPPHISHLPTIMLPWQSLPTTNYTTIFTFNYIFMTMCIWKCTYCLTSYLQITSYWNNLLPWLPTTNYTIIFTYIIIIHS